MSGLLARLHQMDVVFSVDHCLIADSGFTDTTDGVPTVRVGGEHPKMLCRLRRVPKVNEIQALGELEEKYFARLTEVRQAVEWGNKQLKQWFPRLRGPLPVHQAALREQILVVSVHLFNFKTRTYGRNQIATVYNPDAMNPVRVGQTNDGYWNDDLGVDVNLDVDQEDEEDIEEEDVELDVEL
jgi:hypothetical protein